MMETGVDMGDLDVVELLESHLRFGPIPTRNDALFAAAIPMWPRKLITLSISPTPRKAFALMIAHGQNFV